MVPLQPDLSGFPPEALLGPGVYAGLDERNDILPLVCPLRVPTPVYGRSPCGGFSQDETSPGSALVSQLLQRNHLTWHAKDSLPLLTPHVEPLAQRCVKQSRIVNTQGAFVHEIGGIANHCCYTD
jgi:hypothetical protein